MLEHVPLPKPWTFVERLSGRGLEEELELSVAFSELSDLDTDVGEWIQPLTDVARRSMNHSWEKIRNEASGQEVLLRMQKQVTEASRVSSVIFLPKEDFTVSGHDLRSLPIAAIEAAVDEYRFMTRAGVINAMVGGTEDPLAPITGERSTDQFLAAVALQFAALKAAHANPAAEMSKLNNVALSTAQSWITAARKRGMLPAGRPGRAG